MYAVVVTGGKQYRVMEGEVIRVEKLKHEEGDTYNFDQVLMIGGSDGVKVGEDAASVAVSAKVLGHGRHDKVRIIKFRRRKHHMKRMGHRQHYTELEITGIGGASKKKSSKKTAAKKKAEVQSDSEE